MIIEAGEQNVVKSKMQSTNIELVEMKLALALSRKRTSIRWGTNHYCTKHNTLVDYAYIDKCDLINSDPKGVTACIAPLD
jgi:hypothetical protein